MKVKDLKNLLDQVDGELNIIIQNEKLDFYNLEQENSGEVTFQGACDKDGNLLPDGNDEKYDVKMFVLSIVSN